MTNTQPFGVISAMGVSSRTPTSNRPGPDFGRYHRFAETGRRIPAGCASCSSRCVTRSETRTTDETRKKPRGTPSRIQYLVKIRTPLRCASVFPSLQNPRTWIRDRIIEAAAARLLPAINGLRLAVNWHRSCPSRARISAHNFGQLYRRIYAAHEERSAPSPPCSAWHSPPWRWPRRRRCAGRRPTLRVSRSRARRSG